MKLFKTVLFSIVFLGFAHVSGATEPNLFSPNSLAFSGKEAVYKKDSQKGKLKRRPPLNENIRRLLRRESRTEQISTAISLKRSGLRFVNSLWDFEQLTSYAFDNPSDGYKVAVGDFIAQHIHRFAVRGSSFRALKRIESRSHRINQARAVKVAGLEMVRSARQFYRVARPAFENPSDGYLVMSGDFIAQNATLAFQQQPDLRHARDIEGLTVRITQAIAVKRAAMSLVRDEYDFYSIAQLAFDNPSDGYKVAVGDFIQQNVSTALSAYSSISMILQIEGLTNRITQAIAVKRAGLIAVSDINDFWHLSEYAFENPSSGYINAVESFVRENSHRY